MGKLLSGSVSVLCGLALSACAAPAPFPPEVMERVDPTFNFEWWRDAPPNNAAGRTNSGQRVMFGGRIVQAGPDDDGKGILIVAEQLPIQQHPVYGPAEAKRTGQFEFAFLYPGTLKQETLQVGNKFIVVGTTQGRRHVMVEGAPKTEPFLVADCVHIWQTGMGSIAGFEESSGAGYSTLPHETYCAPKKK